MLRIGRSGYIGTSGLTGNRSAASDIKNSFIYIWEDNYTWDDTKTFETNGRKVYTEG